MIRIQDSKLRVAIAEMLQDLQKKDLTEQEALCVLTGALAAKIVGMYPDQSEAVVMCKGVCGQVLETVTEATRPNMVMFYIDERDQT